MACKHCGHEMGDHSFLTCTCPRYAKDGVRIGYDYGQEYEEEENNKSIDFDIEEIINRNRD